VGLVSESFAMRDQPNPARDVVDRFLVKRRTGLRRPGRARSNPIATFADGLAHDVRTPLTVILEYAALLREGLLGDLNDEQQRVLDVIADRASDLNRTIDNAVDASKLATRSHRIWGRSCQVRNIMTRIRPQLLRKAAIRKLELQFEMTTGSAEIYCDEETVGRAITNIVIAAINMAGEGCRVSISDTVHLDHNEVGIHVRVKGARLEAVKTLFGGLLETRATKRETAANRLSELRLAAEFIDCNLGNLALTPRCRNSTTLRIGLPLADPTEILRRHLMRTIRGASGPRAVSLFRAAVPGPIDHELSRGVGGVLNSLIGRDDLIVEIDHSRWLLAVVHRHVPTDTLRRRIEDRREMVNRRRLGHPLPQVYLQSWESWNMPTELARALSTVKRRTEQGALADACAE
jgi:hypothetical protein